MRLAVRAPEDGLKVRTLRHPSQAVALDARREIQ